VRLRVVRTNALVTGDSPAVLEREASALAEAGEHTLKLKVGLGSLAQDVDRVAAVRTGGGGAMALRLDANQAWDEVEARRRIAAFARFGPEYIEQPVAAVDLAALARLRRSSPVPIAADEAARDPAGARRVLEAEAADVLVLKPALGGPAATTRSVVERARRAGVCVVLSSLYDAGISLWASVALAAALGLEAAHGLGTAVLLETPGDAPVPAHGRIELPT
jgi:o-succinylbenzoate synthase